MFTSNIINTKIRISDIIKPSYLEEGDMFQINGVAIVKRQVCFTTSIGTPIFIRPLTRTICSISGVVKPEGSLNRLLIENQSKTLDEILEKVLDKTFVVHVKLYAKQDKGAIVTRRYLDIDFA